MDTFNTPVFVMIEKERHSFNSLLPSKFARILDFKRDRKTAKSVTRVIQNTFVCLLDIKFREDVLA